MALTGFARAYAIGTPELGIVQGIVAGTTVGLSCGVEMRLVSIQAPTLSLGRPGFTPWSLAGKAKTALGSPARDR